MIQEALDRCRCFRLFRVKSGINTVSVEVKAAEQENRRTYAAVLRIKGLGIGGNQCSNFLASTIN